MNKKMTYQVDNFELPVDCYDTSSGSINFLHLHNHYELYLLVEGEIRFFVENHIIDLQPGNLIFLKNNQIHGPIRKKSDVPQKRAAIHFSPKIAREYSNSNYDLLNCFHSCNPKVPTIQLTSAETKQVSKLYTQITKLQHEEEIWGKEPLLNAKLIELLVLCNQLFLKHSHQIFTAKVSSFAGEVITFIQENFEEPELTLGTIGERFNLNPAYLNQIFKKEIGFSIYHYILLNRIAASKRQLEIGKNVTETCFLTGFNDYTNFIKIFKKYVGCTPKQYQKNYRFNKN